ncbi:MAG: acyl-CoA dehydrogenase family protein [Thermaurantiacus tibetensis]|uniref:acyl-CoA dehydrogenase family protein n=1 Tax=Thermaurantiacus tibetensis TaxID=2759035 RepID=UPI00188EC968|nr:acyl-CoA dehydrogenase family protein [Thermaurantiacus tibetensis]
MDFGFTETQTMLREQLARFFRERYDFDTRQKMLAREGGRDPAVWKAFAEELGILGAGFPESLGGLGGGAVEHMVIMEELGRAIAIEPYLDTCVIGGHALLAASGPLAESLVPGIIAGDVIMAFAWAEPKSRYNPARIATRASADGAGWTLDGHKAVVLAAPWATHWLVTARTSGSPGDRDGVSLFLVEAGVPGVTRRDYPTVDGIMASELYFERSRVGPHALLGREGEALPLVEELLDRAAAATCAEAAGTMRRLHELTLDYAKQRVQFGQPISRFQVIQHRLVDMLMEVEQAVSMAYQATLRLDLPAPERARAVSQAKAKIAKGARFLGQAAVQTHGGIGITNELAAGHYFKRLTMLESRYGDQDHHLARLEALMMAEAA